MNGNGKSEDLVGVYKATLTTGLMQREIRAWALLAVGSLAIAGLFALFTAASRIPGSNEYLSWPMDFFHKGLVIHVVFSFVIWFLAVFALLASLATYRLSKTGEIRMLWAGWAGAIITAISFPMLFVPGFIKETQAVLSNYIPAIDHPLYEIGLVFLFTGILLPIIRLLVNLPLRPRENHDHLSHSTLFGSGIFIVALICMAIAILQSSPATNITYEHIFWGGGHVLQFLNTLLMLCGWVLLARFCSIDKVFDIDIARLATILLLICTLPALVFYFKFEPFSAKQTAGFTYLQLALGLPAILVAGSGFFSFLRHYKTNGSLPWGNLPFLCLVLSMVVFGIGGLLGFMVDGADTRTPAHYHGVIAGVNLTFMGLFMFFVLPVLGETMRSGKTVRLVILMFGLGQMLASIGLFMAGGYGAPRKAAADTYVAVDGAVVGLYLNGIGALVAVIGGAIFIWIILAALLRPARAA
ncbi:MAG: hypothetical protein GY927_24155 [bacterium]|nr:hypothetical protein [bacterium]